MEFDGKHRYSDLGRIQRSLKIAEFLKNEGREQEARELKALCIKNLKKYKEVYGEGIKYPSGNY